MRVAILYNEPRDGSEASDEDVLVQRDCVVKALSACGHESREIACTLDLASLYDVLRADPPDCVFNLVESLGGTDRLQPVLPVLLDALGIPYTGSPAAAMLEASDKLGVKRRLHRMGLPTPEWIDSDCPADASLRGTFIVKARFEHASVGMDDSAVVDIRNAGEIEEAIRARSAMTGLEMFAERFIEGREFNIAMIAAVGGKPEVLSPAEIDFSAFPAGKPKIVGYDAKWTDESFEFNATPRRFSFPPSDRALLDEFATLSRAVWNAFELGGYARIDFRVDEHDRPQILEINTNPCLSPDAGFAAALAASGYTFERGIELIVNDALKASR